MPFKNAILGGDTLVRDAIQSANYVAGVSGWRISRDGNAELNDVTIRGHWLIQGTPPNQNALIEGRLAGSSPQLRWVDVDSYEYTMTATGESAGNPLTAALHIEATSAVLNPSSFHLVKTGGIALRSGRVGFTTSTSAGQCTAFDDATGYIRVAEFSPLLFETAVAIPFSNGWSNFGSGYAPFTCRRLPHGFVQVQGTIKPGTTVDGTVIGTLPLLYRPSTLIRVPWVDLNRAGMADIATNGQISVYNAVGTTTASFCVQIPLL